MKFRVCILVVLLAFFASCTQIKIQPKDSHTAFIKLYDLNGEPLAFASGWFIASKNGVSILATAGHVCSMVPGGKITETDRDNDDREAYPVYYENDDDSGLDACLLIVLGNSPKVMNVGKTFFGETVWYVGWPAGQKSLIYGHTGEVTSDGYVSMALPAAGGASGSAIVDEYGTVVGMIVEVDLRFNQISYAVYGKRLFELKSMAEQIVDRVQ